MSALSGLVEGALALTLLEVVVTNRNGEAGRVSNILDWVAGGVHRWLDPTIPLIPQRKTSSGGGKVESIYIPPTSPATPAPAPPAGIPT